jgi:cytochrome P450
MPLPRPRPALEATRDDLLAFRYLMRSATAVVTIPAAGHAEARAPGPKRHVEGLIRPMLAEPVAPERTDLLATSVPRMREAGLLDEAEIVAHLTFVIAASFDALSSGTVSTLYYLAANPAWQAGCGGIVRLIPDRSISIADLAAASRRNGR